jgi:iron complex transport system substrate-binding protein
MIRRLLLAALLAHASLAWAQPLPTAPTAPTAQPPQRVVSLLPSITETVCVLGACDRLVGVDRHSNWPQRVQALPKLGGLNDTSVEGIVALKPDLVLLAQSARVTERLRSLGLKVVTIEPQTNADVEAALRQVAALLGLPAQSAESVWNQINANFPPPVGFAPSVPNTPGRDKTVYFEVGSGFAAGQASFVGEWLMRLGAPNAVPASLGTFPRLNPEFVVRANPWLIITSEREAALLAQRPGWATLDAVKAGRVCGLSPAQSEVVGRPGPRMAEAARALADCLRRFP